MNDKPATEYDRFTRFVDRALSVPKSEIQRREEEYKNTPKPKPVPKKSASHDSAA